MAVIDKVHVGTADYNINAILLNGLTSDLYVLIAGDQTITGNKTFNSDVDIDSLTAGDVIVNGSANFTSDAFAVTPASGDSSTKIATTEFVENSTAKSVTLTGSTTGTGTFSNGAVTIPTITKIDNIYPIAEQTYTEIYSSGSSSTPNASVYFGLVIPTERTTGANDAYYNEWSIRYRLEISMLPINASGNTDSTAALYNRGYFDVIMNGRTNTVITYYIMNNHANESYRTMYYHVLSAINETGIKAGYGHELGICLLYSWGKYYNSAGALRTVKVTVLEEKNCHINLYDNWAYGCQVNTSYTNYGGTNYYSVFSTFNGANNGLCETYDLDSGLNSYWDYIGETTGDVGFKAYTLVMRTAADRLDSVVTTSTTATTKAVNTAKFMIGSKIFYGNSYTVNPNTPLNTSWRSIYSLIRRIDFRYSSNCGTTLTGGKPVYFVGTRTSDGCFLLDTTTWWTQIIPTSEDGKIYVRIGGAYNNYLVDLYEETEWYEYSGGSFHVLGANDLLQEITYADLVSLRNNSKLVPGKQYRITDYVCTTTASDTQSAGHQFDIIVTADDVDTLNDNARAALHSGDTYFADCNLDAWQLKYCIDNDTDRFEWADSTNGKGVIYYMKDEYENECAYDFKNIMYKLLKLTSINWYISSWIESDYTNEFVGHYVGSWFTINDYGSVTLSTTDTKYFYTFNKGGNDADDILDGSILNKNSLYNVCRQNVIPERITCDSNNKYTLNWIIFKPFSSEDDYSENNYSSLEYDYYSSGDDCYQNSFGNVFGKDCYNNLFDCSWTYQNSFGNECYNNSFGNNCISNSFGNSCYSNILGNNCKYNLFENDCGFNLFANDCYSNSFGNSCLSNVFGNGCYNNSFGNVCLYNSFEDWCNCNSFGNGCYYNSFRKNCCLNSFGNECCNNIFSSMCTRNSFGNECGSNSFGSLCDDNSFGNECFRNSFTGTCDNNSFGNACKYNLLRYYCNNNRFGNYCGVNASETASSTTGNILGYYCQDNVFEDHCYANKLVNTTISTSRKIYNNSFGEGCYSNTLNYSCYNNSFGEGCYSNTLKYICYSNSFGNYCGSNSFGNGCYNNSFENNCYSNSFGNYCYNNSFGNVCLYNSFGNDCGSNSFGNDCYLIKFGTSSAVNDYYRYIRIESGNQYIYLSSTGTRSSSQYYRNVIIGAGVNNTTTYKTITDANVGQTYETRYVATNSQTIPL